MTELSLTLDGRETSVAIHTVIVAGWTGRDREAVEKHMAELEAVGVPRPSTAPVFYRVSASRLTTASSIESTAASSGEVEPVLLQHEGRLWVGGGSDHTDREVETYGVNVSKQLCDKPIAREFWAYDDVAGHWDELVLRSWIDGDVLYQEGPLSRLMHPDVLRAEATPRLMDGTLMFCGTIAAIGGIRPAAEFAFELADPVRDRAIRGHYEMRTLPLVS
ncbi:MAG TPA: DUF2848 domain-containing protein [Thermoleophilaceae bacterium]